MSPFAGLIVHFSTFAPHESGLPVGSGFPELEPPPPDVVPELAPASLSAKRPSKSLVQAAAASAAHESAPTIAARFIP